jgi:cell division septation protein DedD
LSNEDQDIERPIEAVKAASSNGMKLLPIILALVIVVVFAAGAWYALRGPADSTASNGQPPTVVADLSPIKEKPADPGGLKIPDQDKLVYERLTPAPKPTEEAKLAPPPEAPVKRPEPQSAEEKPAETTMTPAAPPAAPAAVQEAAEKAGTTEATVKEAAKAPPAAEPAPKPENAKNAEPPAPEKPADTPAQTVTEKPAAAPQTSAATPAKQEPKPAAEKAPPPTKDAYFVQLAAYRSSEAALDSWRRLREQFKPIVGNLDARVQKADLKAKGVFYRLQAGPIADARTAEDICAKLQARKQGCLVVRPK